MDSLLELISNLFKWILEDKSAARVFVTLITILAIGFSCIVAFGFVVALYRGQSVEIAFGLIKIGEPPVISSENSISEAQPMSTPQPTVINMSFSSATPMPVIPTNTSMPPSPTFTPQPTGTNTLLPTPTDTPQPTSTWTPASTPESPIPFVDIMNGLNIPQNVQERVTISPNSDTNYIHLTLKDFHWETGLSVNELGYLVDNNGNKFDPHSQNSLQFEPGDNDLKSEPSSHTYTNVLPEVSFIVPSMITARQNTYKVIEIVTYSDGKTNLKLEGQEINRDTQVRGKTINISLQKQ